MVQRESSFGAVARQSKGTEIVEGMAFKLWELDGGTREYWDADTRGRKEYRHRALLMARFLQSQRLVIQVDKCTLCDGSGIVLNIWDNTEDCPRCGNRPARYVPVESLIGKEENRTERG